MECTSPLHTEVGSLVAPLSRKSDRATNGSARRSVRGLPHDAASLLGTNFGPASLGLFSLVFTTGRLIQSHLGSPLASKLLGAPFGC
jgi:hypothetical protein